MKHFLFLTLLSSVGHSLWGGLPENIFSEGHADLRVDYETESGAWTLSIDRGENGSQTGPLYDPATVVLVAPPSARTTLPSMGSQWAFLGNVGDDVWVLDQGGGAEGLHLGFNQYGIASGVIQMRLLDHDGPADFVLFTTQNDHPTVLWDTRPTQGPYGTRNLQAGGHSHANWAFRERGIHFLTIEASGTLLATGEVVRSEPIVLTFAIDPDPWHWWQLEHFGKAANQAIAGPTADFSGNGIPNLLEFALGLIAPFDRHDSLPRTSILVDDGKEYLALSFRQPPGRSGIHYQVETSSDLVSWLEVSTLPQATPMEESNIDGVPWVTVRDDIPLDGLSGRYMRLRVTYDPSG